jgi:hydrogenase nickel insertion protein HypA
MHEYSLMQNILESVVRDLQGRGLTAPGSVATIHLVIGALEIHSRESFEQAFTVAARGTPLEGAALELEVLPAALRCEACGHTGPVVEGEADGHSPLPVSECPRCGRICAVEGGRGVQPVQLTLNGP